ncbi:MAG: hypothetical protein OXF74_02640 [Rhodobacteraceae bacterium]|nr:hypothetical protein [Paracoccaceae bacterium]
MSGLTVREHRLAAALKTVSARLRAVSDSMWCVWTDADGQFTVAAHKQVFDEVSADLRVSRDVLTEYGLAADGGEADPWDANRAAAAVTEEYLRARNRFADYNSPHEGYAVLLEEVDELWEAVRRNDNEAALREAVQVGAVALRFLIDCREPDRSPE